MTPKILVIDNNVGSLITLKSILQETIPGCEVFTASFREQGIEKAKKESPDTILLDSKMMEKGSHEICKRLKDDAKMHKIPLILMNSNGDDFENCFQDSRTYIDVIIKKQWSEVELSTTINQLLRNKNDEVKTKKGRNEEPKENEGYDKEGYGNNNDFGQLLSALKTDLQWLKKKLPDELTDEHKKIDSMFELINVANLDVKKVTTKFKPSNLYDQGFMPTLKQYAKEFQTRTGINCKAHFVQKDIQIDKSLSTLLFGILDEILSNVEKHSNASRVKITVNLRNDRLMMKINDDGIGIIEEKVNDPQSIGLKSIRERVLLHNGNIVIRGFVAKGTKVVINIPLKK